MERIKNLKINFKKTISVLLTTTVLSTLAGCCTENHEEIIENQNNTISSLEQEKANLEQEKAKLQEQLNKLKETSEPETASENLNSDNINDLSSDGAVQLFYENGVLKVDSIGQPYYLKYYKDYNGGSDTGDNAGYVQELIKDGKKYLVDANDFSKVLLSDYESLGAPYYLKYYDEHNGGPDNNNVNGDGFVQEIVKSGKKYLVDANDFSKVLLSDYESLGAPYYLKYYDEHNGGPDNNDVNGDGFVQEIVKNGKKYLVDANDFNQVLLSDYESLGAPYYLKYYDEHNGGPDNNDVNGDGFVQEIIKDGKKYLIDANDFCGILASDYTSIVQNNLNTTIVFADGHTEVYANKDFKPEKSDVLVR